MPLALDPTSGMVSNCRTTVLQPQPLCFVEKEGHLNHRFSLGYFLCALVLMSVMGVSRTSAANALRLWYDEPAEVWEEALPIGNGRIGGMVFGDPSHDRVQLNEDTLWAGEPGNNLPAGFLQALPEVRQLLFDGEYKAAETKLMEVVPRRAGTERNYGMPYQTVGSLEIRVPGVDPFSGYQRDLDLQNAIASVVYDVDGVTFHREYFVSAPDQVMVIHFSADQTGAINCDLALTSPQLRQEVCHDEIRGEWVLSGVSGDHENKKGSVKFQVRLLPVLKGGTVGFGEEGLEIRDADEMTLFVSIATNFKHFRDLSADEEAKAMRALDRVRDASYADIREAHVADYRDLFDRVTLDLGVTEAATHPTDERLEAFYDGEDPALVSLYFQYGRYLLIASSRVGTQPANLQGIWNPHLSPPWDSKYTININTEMNYWPAELTNLSELHEPLFSMIRDLQQTGGDAAREMYGARGWVVHHNTDIWRMSGPIDGGFYGMWPMGGAWLSQHLWQHYLFTGDQEFLQDNYEILRDVALFYLDVLQKDPVNGWWVVSPQHVARESPPPWNFRRIRQHDGQPTGVRCVFKPDPGIRNTEPGS